MSAKGNQGGILKALGTDFNFVNAVWNPFDHADLPISHMLETVASSRDMVSRLASPRAKDSTQCRGPRTGRIGRSQGNKQESDGRAESRRA